VCGDWEEEIVTHEEFVSAQFETELMGQNESIVEMKMESNYSNGQAVFLLRVHDGF
jgi:hypothetical protein